MTTPDEPAKPPANGIPTVDRVEFYTDQATRSLAAKIPPRFPDAPVDHPDVDHWVAQFLADPTTCPNLLLIGATGTGKTWAAYTALRAAVMGRAKAGKGTRWQVVTHAALNAQLRPQPDDSHVYALDTYIDADLLMLDDLGAGKASEWTGDNLLRLVDTRWNHCRPAIVTTNLDPDGLLDAVGSRVVSRVADNVIRVTLAGRDKRLRKVSAA